MSGNIGTGTVLEFGFCPGCRTTHRLTNCPEDNPPEEACVCCEAIRAEQALARRGESRLRRRPKRDRKAAEDYLSWGWEVRQVWEVCQGEYSDRYTAAVCSSEQQAMGVAIKLGHGAYVGSAVDLWEPEDGIPPYRAIYTVIVRPGRDSGRPLDISVHQSPIPVDAELPRPNVATSSATRVYRWARAENYTSAEEAEAAARAAFEELTR